MSLSYKTPGESFCNFLSQKHTESISVRNIDRLALFEERLAPFFSFFVNEKKKKFLSEWGIYLSPFAWQTHSHPACKMIENELLFINIYYYVHENPSSKFVLMSLRDSKFQTFKGFFPKPKKKDLNSPSDPVLDMLVNFNRCITVKDFARYGIDRRKQLASCLKTSPDFVGHNFVIHDELHYWSPRDLNEFICHNEPNSILATIIHPIEYDDGFEHSMLPEIYEFTVRGDSIFFFPDGNKSEAYEQPKTAGWLLHCSTFKTQGACYGVTRLKSIGPFHLVLIKRDCLVTETRRFFSDFSCVSFPRSLEMRGHGFDETRLHGETFRKIIRYVMSLKKPDKESVMAKLRMMDDESRDLDQSLLCAKLTNSLLKDKILENFDVSLIDWLVNGLKDCLGSRILSVFNSSYFKSKSNLELLMHMKELAMEVKTREMDFMYNHSSWLTSWLNKVKDIGCMNGSDGVLNLFRLIGDRPFPPRGQVIFHGCQGYSAKTEKLTAESIDQSVLSFEDENGGFCVNTHLENPLLEIDSNDLKTELAMNAFWADKKRVEIAQKKSLSDCPELEDDYILVKAGPLSSYGRNGVDFFYLPIIHVNRMRDRLRFNLNSPGQWISRKNLSWLAIHNAYVPLPQLTMTEEGNVHKEIDSLKPFDRFVKITRREIPEIISVPPISQVLSQSNLKDGGMNWDSMKNACCFVALKESMSALDEEFLSVLNPKFIDLLIRDSGLQMEEFHELLESLKFNFIFCSESGSELGFSDRGIGPFRVFELRDDHCTFLGNEEDIECARSSYGLNSRSFGGNTLGVKTLFDPASRVEKLIHCFENGHTGVKVKSIIENFRNAKQNKPAHAWRHLPNKSLLNNLVDECYSNNDVFMILGAAGSGKSFSLINAMLTGDMCKERTLVISPRKALRDDFASKVEFNKNVEVVTFENSFDLWYLSTFDNIVLDEISLYPPGFFDLLLLSSQLQPEKKFRNQIKKDDMIENGKRFYLLGDFAQMRYHGESDSPRLDRNDEIDYLGGRIVGSLSYKAYSFRNPVDFKFKLGHENLGEEQECREPRFFINCQAASLALPESQIMVASQEEQNKFKNFGAKTFGSLQGMTVMDSLVCLSPATLSCDNNTIYVALSRAKRNVDFFLHGYTSKDEFMERCRGSSLAGILSIGSFNFLNIAIKNFEKSTKKKVNLMSRKGLSQDDIEEKLSGDPYLKSIIPLCEPIINHVEPCMVPCEQSANPKIHLPIWEKNNYCAEVTTRMRNRELREFWSGNAMSEQFPDYFKKGEPQSLLPNPNRFQGIYPKHSNSDPITFFAAVKKRLKFSCPAKEREKFENVLHLGEEMFQCFLEKVPIDGKIDRNMMEESEQEYVAKKVSKSGATITSHVKRSDPDWGKHEIFLFIKTQLCTKYEKRFCDAKAGQTLACFSHKLLNRFAGPCRYLEKKLQKAMPERFYIHQKKDFNQLNKWVIESDFSGVCTESDYEAFDSSQDALILAMEYAMLKHIQWDKSLIEDYLDMKFNLGCRLGNLAVMRFTGEFGTFILNTICNMAFTFMTYDIGPKTCIAFAGDDMCANTPLVVYGEDGPYEHILKKLTLKAKVDRTKNPTFCGWRLTKRGLYKRPELILDRLLISEEKGTFRETLDGYLLEFSYAYNLGEWLFESFSDKEFEAHYICTRLFVKNRKRISNSLQKFVDQIQDPTIRKGRCQLSRSMNSSSLTIQEQKGLIVSTQTTSTKTLDSSNQNLSMLCKEMNVQFQLNLMGVHQSLWAFRSCTREQSMRRGERRSTNGSTLVQSQLAYTNLGFMKQIKQPAQCLLSMAGKKAETVSSRHTILTSQTSLHITCSRQMLIFHSMTNFFSGLVRSMLNLTKIIIKRGASHLLWKLVQYFASPMHSTVYIKWVTLKQVSLGVITKTYSTQSAGVLTETLKLQGNITETCLCLEYYYLNRPQSQRLLKGRNQFGGEEEEDPQSLSITRLNLCLKSWDCKDQARLSQATVELMNLDQLTLFWIIRLGHLSDQMSSVIGQKQKQKEIKEWIYEKTVLMKPRTPPSVSILRLRRRMLLRNHYILVIHKSFPKLGQDPEKWNDDQKQQYSKLMDDFASFSFGNLSIYGFSEATKYPIYEIGYDVEYGEPPEKVGMKMKLSDLKHAFKYYADQSGVDELAGLTWRQIGECFAEDIRIYLRDIEPDAKTWLVNGNPLLAGLAPWVATDVTGGLWKPLSPEEKKVITKVNNHLLKTQNLKNQIRDAEVSTVET